MVRIHPRELDKAGCVPKLVLVQLKTEYEDFGEALVGNLLSVKRGALLLVIDNMVGNAEGSGHHN